MKEETSISNLQTQVESSKPNNGESRGPPSSQIRSPDPKRRAAEAATRPRTAEGTAEVAGEAGAGAGASVCAPAEKAMTVRMRAVRETVANFANAILRSEVGGEARRAPDGGGDYLRAL